MYDTPFHSASLCAAEVSIWPLFEKPETRLMILVMMLSGRNGTAISERTISAGMSFLFLSQTYTNAASMMDIQPERE